MTEINETDWSEIYLMIRNDIEHSLRQNDKLSNSATWMEGDAWISALASRISYDVHRKIDPTYDS